MEGICKSMAKLAKWDTLTTYYNIANEIRVSDANLDLRSLGVYVLMAVSSGKEFKLYQCHCNKCRILPLPIIAK